MSMVSTDPIADMLTRIRNAINVHKSEVLLPHSKIKEAVAKVLVANNYLDSAKVIDASVGKTMKITINGSNENARITEIVRMSKPGRRQYVTTDTIPKVKGGRGIVVVSTSQGLMTGAQAKQKRLGGELICKVY